MARLLRIEICDQCDHRGRYDDRCYGVYPHREFDDKCKPEIPDWCPLPEACVCTDCVEASDGATD